MACLIRLALLSVLFAAPTQAAERLAWVGPDGHAFCLHQAISAAERGRGFRDRPAPDQHTGMWFVFAEPRISAFWMKEVAFALQIIWLDEHYQVVGLAAAPPCPDGYQCPVYHPEKAAQYVLELAPGRLDLALGDYLQAPSGTCT